MKEYTSCFIGIPLPQEYQSAFEDLLADISDIAPLLETTSPETPHITGYYLDKQSQNKLPEIADLVRKNVDLLRGVELTVGGFGYFRPKNPKVIYLNVQFPESLRVFNNSLTESLAAFYAPDNNLPFHPHMTVARLRTPQAQLSFTEAEPGLRNRLSVVEWKYPVTEVVLYGVDSTQNPQHQQKLVSITLK